MTRSEAPAAPPSLHLTVGELARRSGVTVSALHFYERQGLISSTRTAGNQRRYRRDTLRRVALIRIAQRVGIPLKEVAEVLRQLPDGRTPDREDWIRVSAHWRQDLEERIHRLEQLRDDFGDCVGCGCLSLDRCRMLNPDDQLGDRGPGPRRLLGRRRPRHRPEGREPDADRAPPRRSAAPDRGRRLPWHDLDR